MLHAESESRKVRMTHLSIGHRKKTVSRDWVIRPLLNMANVFFIATIFISCGRLQKPSVETKSVTRICFTGDVMLARGVSSKIRNKGKGFMFDSIRSALEQYKYRFINLECPITKLNYPPDKPYSFRADSNYLGILTSAGITHATLANNHIDDQRPAGALDTYNLLIENGITPIGLKSKNDTICRPAEIDLSKRKVAVFGALGIDMKLSNIWYCRDSHFLKSLELYKKKNPGSFVICYVHWGIEYYDHPSYDQILDAKKMIDLGADMIIGHHPHVIESIRYYKGKPILYSLGNMIFDQHDPDTKKGIIAGLTVEDSAVETEITPYNIKEDRPVPMEPNEKQNLKEYLLKISDDISLIDNSDGWTLAEKNKDQVAQSDTTMLACSSIRIDDGHFNGTAELIKLKSLPGYKLRLTDMKSGITDDHYIPYPIYRFYASDVNNDGKTDLLLGVVKSAHFDAAIRKRLFIFGIDSSRLSPLWLGTRVCLELVDFKPIHRQNETQIMTVEKDSSNSFCNGLYKWDNFGFRLIGYKNENSTKASSYEYFNGYN